MAGARRGSAWAALVLVVAVPAWGQQGVEAGVELRGGADQNTLAVRREGTTIVARACVPQATCAPDGGERFELPAEVRPAETRIEEVRLAGGRRVALVSVPAAPGAASLLPESRADAAARPGGEAPTASPRWVLLLAATPASQAPAVRVLLRGPIDHARGPAPGERHAAVVLRERAGDGERLLVGRQYESASVCGRPATLAARELDPRSLEWTPAAPRALGPAEVASAPSLVATRTSEPFRADPRLLHALFASGGAGVPALSDGDLGTRWRETDPGDGRGHFAVLSASPDVGILGFELVLRPTGPEAEGGGAAPRVLWLATRRELFRVTLPEDAWQAQPGAAYAVALPRAVHTDCVAVLLDEAYVRDGASEVGIAEVRARTELDALAGDVAALVRELGAAEARARAAQALLSRGGPAAVRATVAAWDALAESARERALAVIESGDCQDTVPFFVERVLAPTPSSLPSSPPSGRRGNGHQGAEGDLPPPPPPDLESAGETTVRRARERLRSCRAIAEVALGAALRAEPPGPRQTAAAHELATVAPHAAPPLIAAVLDAGPVEVRRSLRAALGVAVRSSQGRAAAASLLEPGRFGAFSLVARIDLLRAVGTALPSLPHAGAALASTAAADRSFRTRYLVLEPAAHLARAGDAAARALVERSLSSDESEHVRAQAARAAGGVPALELAVARALADPVPRVREAALGALGAASNPLAPAAEAAVVARLGDDPWTFVRSGAARALARRPRTQSGDRALVAALGDEAWLVRTAALRSLGARRSTGSADAVEAVAADADELVDVRVAAIGALGDLCHRAATPLLYKLALRIAAPELPYDEPLGLAALGALGALQPAGLRAALGPLLTDARVPRRVRAIARDVLRRPGRCGPGSRA
jgi:HEAT repeat protein